MSRAVMFPLVCRFDVVHHIYLISQLLPLFIDFLVLLTFFGEMIPI